MFGSHFVETVHSYVVQFDFVNYVGWELCKTLKPYFDCLLVCVFVVTGPASDKA